MPSTKPWDLPDLGVASSQPYHTPSGLVCISLDSKLCIIRLLINNTSSLTYQEMVHVPPRTIDTTCPTEVSLGILAGNKEPKLNLEEKRCYLPKGNYYGNITTCPMTDMFSKCGQESFVCLNWFLFWFQKPPPLRDKVNLNAITFEISREAFDSSQVPQEHWIRKQFLPPDSNESFGLSLSSWTTRLQVLRNKVLPVQPQDHRPMN